MAMASSQSDFKQEKNSFEVCNVTLEERCERSGCHLSASLQHLMSLLSVRYVLMNEFASSKDSTKFYTLMFCRYSLSISVSERALLPSMFAHKEFVLVLGTSSTEST